MLFDHIMLFVIWCSNLPDTSDQQTYFCVILVINVVVAPWMYFMVWTMHVLHQIYSAVS